MTAGSMVRVAAAGILTLVSSLVAVTTSSAYDRSNAVTLANNMIERCVREGGEPDGISSEQTVLVYCKMPKGEKAGDLCEFWPGPPTCYLLPDLRDDRGELLSDGGTLHAGDATRPAETTQISESANGNQSIRSAQHGDEKHRGHKSRKQKGNDRRHGKR